MHCYCRYLFLIGLICWGPFALGETQSQNNSEEVSASTDEPRARNVILMIGDGMGPQQLSLLFAYAQHTGDPEKKSAIEQLLDRSGNIALVRTEPHGALVVDSAAAATQLATGQYAGSEMIGVNYQGDSAPTVLEIAKQHGKSTGLISDTRITHATPAAFASHQRHRSLENEIAVDMFENRVDVMLSAGLRYWVPQAVNQRDSAAYLALLQMIGGAYDPISKREDNRNLLLEARAEYQLVFDRSALAQVNSGKVLGLFANSEMLDALAERRALKTGVRTEPTLDEMTSKALEILDQNPEGFFLMVEGGQIDWACHNNDSGTLLAEMLRFDRAVRTVMEWVEDRDDTLVLITADHETGSFGFSYHADDIPDARRIGGDVFGREPFEPDFNFVSPKVLDRLDAQSKSFFQIFTEFDALPSKKQSPERLMEIINEGVAPFSITLADAAAILTRSANPYFREGHSYLGTKTLPQITNQQAFFVYGENLRMNRLGHILAAQQGTVWGTGTHTNTPVPLITHGPHADRFRGILHATDVGKGMIELVGGQK